jgi:hypothetical protein
MVQDAYPAIIIIATILVTIGYYLYTWRNPKK